MLYKGGPKNYSKRDWQILGGIIGVAVAGMLIGKLAGTSSTQNAPDTVVSSDTLEAVQHAGYKGDEARQVAEAAERLQRACGAEGRC